jgi:hypothetical protein
LIVSHWTRGSLNEKKTYERHEDKVRLPGDVVDEGGRDLDNYKNLGQISIFFRGGRLS